MARIGGASKLECDVNLGTMCYYMSCPENKLSIAEVNSTIAPHPEPASVKTTFDVKMQKI